MDRYIKLLCCPNCKSDLIFKKANLSCVKCKLEYPVIKGVPVFSKNLANLQIKKQERIFNSEYKKVKEYTIHEWQKSFISRMVRGFNLKGSAHNKTYIDIGAGGPGYTVIEMAKRGITSIGIDISLGGMLKANKFAISENVGNNCLFIVANAEEIPIKTSCVDYASSIMLLEHLDNDADAIAEISRILKKNGKVFISVPNTYMRMWPFLWPVYKVWDKKLGHVRHYSQESLIKLFKLNKLSSVKIFYTVHLVKFLQVILVMMMPRRYKNKVWWVLEELDMKQKNIKTGLNINAFFKK